MAEEKSFFVSFLKKEKVNHDTWTFYFEKPVGFRYVAGQYIKIKLPINNPDNRGISRYFTLSSSPTDEYLTITTRIIKSTFKMTLSGLKKGEKIETRGPWGDFVLDEKDTRTRVFIAGGIGLTPFHSIIRYAAATKLTIPIFLFVSFKTEKDIVFEKELRQVEEIHKHIKVIFTLTTPPASWKGESGRITTQLLQKYVAKSSQNVYYISGPDPMIESLQKLLVDSGVREKDILTDGFPGYK